MVIIVEKKITLQILPISGYFQNVTPAINKGTLFGVYGLLDHSNVNFIFKTYKIQISAEQYIKAGWLN